MVGLHLDEAEVERVTWPQTSCGPFAMKSHAKGSNCQTILVYNFKKQKVNAK